jgi:hypothetical protein
VSWEKPRKNFTIRNNCYYQFIRPSWWNEDKSFWELHWQREFANVYLHGSITLRIIRLPVHMAFAHDVAAAMLMFQFKIILIRLFFLEHQHGSHGFCCIFLLNSPEAKNELSSLFRISATKMTAHYWDLFFWDL